MPPLEPLSSASFIASLLRLGFTTQLETPLQTTLRGRGRVVVVHAQRDLLGSAYLRVLLDVAGVAAEEFAHARALSASGVRRIEGVSTESRVEAGSGARTADPVQERLAKIAARLAALDVAKARSGGA